MKYFSTKRTTLLTILFVAVAHLSTAQQRDFLFIDKDIETNQMASCALEMRDGSFCIASTASRYNPLEPCHLFKVSNDGELLRKTTITTGWAIVAGLIDGSLAHYEDTCYYAVGYRQIGVELHTPFVIRFDSDLNIISSTDVELPENFYFLDQPQIRLEKGGIVFFRSFVRAAQALHLRLTLDGEVLDYALVSCNTPTGSIVDFPDGSHGLYVYGQFSRITDSLTLEPIHLFNQLLLEPYLGDTIHWYSIDLSGETCPSATVLPDSSLVVADMATENWYDIFGHTFGLDFGQSVFFRSNLGGEINEMLLVNTSDTLERPCLYNAIDYRSQDSIFLCAYQASDLFGSEIVMGNKIYVKLTDNNLIPIWEREIILGPEHYQPIYMLATSDGGCLVTGRVCYYHSIQNSDLFAFKVNADGSVGTKENQKEKHNLCIFHPNPTTGLVAIKGKNLKAVELLNIIGQKVAAFKGEGETTQIDISHLPAGIYTMRVTMEDGKTFTDKVVKE